MTPWAVAEKAGAQLNAGVTVESSLRLRVHGAWMLSLVLHPTKVVLWLMGTGELGWGPRAGEHPPALKTQHPVTVPHTG